MSLFQCKICNHTTYEASYNVKEMMFYTQRSYIYSQCASCGTLQIETQELDSEFLYPSSYYSFSTGEQSIKAKVKRVINNLAVSQELNGKKKLPDFLLTRDNRDIASIKAYLKSEMRVLDVGCGSGDLVMALFDLGFPNVRGLDPYIGNTIQYKDTVIEKKSLFEIQAEQYDIIMLHHSFEHMPNPAEVLTKIKQILSPSGICVIRIPVADSYAFKHYKENWVQLDAPRHVFLHTNKSIDFLVSNADLKVQKIIDDSGSFQFIGSEQYLKGVSLSAPQSFFKPFYKKLFRPSLFSKQQLDEYQRSSNRLNLEGQGDQRIYYITHQRI